MNILLFLVQLFIITIAIIGMVIIFFQTLLLFTIEAPTLLSYSLDSSIQESISSHKILLFIIIALPIILGFISWDVVTSIYTNAFIAIIVYILFPNKLVTVLFITSTIIWALIDKDYYSIKKPSDKNEPDHRFIKMWPFYLRLLSFICVLQLAFSYATNYAEFLVNNYGQVVTGKDEIIRVLLMMLLPTIFCLVLFFIQRNYTKKKEPLNNIRAKIPHAVYYTMIAMRILCLLIIIYILISKNGSFIPNEKIADTLKEGAVIENLLGMACMHPMIPCIVLAALMIIHAISQFTKIPNESYLIDKE